VEREKALSSVLDYLKQRSGGYRDELFELLRIASISAQPAHRDDVRRAANWVRDRCVRAGLNAEVVESAGHPAVIAAGPQQSGRPTVLFYGHFDVQPEGDLSLWRTGPFEPVMDGGRIVARGAADDKGQMLCAVYAAEAWMQATGSIPVNLKFLIEGEEEIGSPNLAELVRARREQLACDYVLIHDTAKFDADTPAVTTGTKGLVYKELIVTGPKKDLHSGVYGGQVANPANVLAQLIASFHDARGRITIPSFYDRVRPLAPAELETIRTLPFVEAEFLADVGSAAPAGEAGYSTLERRWSRPTLDVNGIYGGYMGPGSSTIIPSRAGAKVSMRLVPDMRADEIDAAFAAVVRARCPATVRVEILDHARCDPYTADLGSAGMRAARAAVARGFGREPVLIREGGTLPILPMFKQVLRTDSILMGYCVPTCNAHSPNEFFDLGDFDAGMRSTAAFLGLLDAAAS
jgi:acetylornithine deacetylase/succinyl-diaminopimelate desuccinylase-like protein